MKTLDTTVLFPLGTVSISQAAEEAIEMAGQSPYELLWRHVRGDWGDLSEDELEENTFAFDEGWSLESRYILHSGDCIAVLTTSDRQRTTLRLVGEDSNER